MLKLLIMLKNLNNVLQCLSTITIYRSGYYYGMLLLFYRYVNMLHLLLHEGLTILH